MSALSVNVAQLKCIREDSLGAVRVMASWLTVKDNTDSLQTDRSNIENEPIKELGIHKLRLTYTAGLNALHCSEDIGDEKWLESKICFEEVIRIAGDSADEAGAARSECTLLLFLSNSNLSRMLAKSDLKPLALYHALDAASIMSIEDSSVHDPGLLLRIAKLTLELQDSWSCKQLLGYRVRHDRRSSGSSVGGLLDSFYQLRDNLQYEISSSSSSFKSQLSMNKRETASLTIDRATLDFSGGDFFDSLATVLASEAPKKSFDYSFLVSNPELQQRNASDEEQSNRGFRENLQMKSGYEIPVTLDTIICDLTEESENHTDENPRDETASSASSGRKYGTATEPRKVRSVSSSDPKAQNDNIGSTLSRRKKESLSLSSTSSSRFTHLQVNNCEEECRIIIVN